MSGSADPPEQHGAADPLDPVRAHIDAFNARDLEGVLATFADDAVFAAGDELVVGVRSLRLLFGDAFAAPVDAKLALRHAVVQGDVVACELTETLTVETTSHDLEVAAFYTVRRGELTRVKIYRDLSEPEGRG